MLETIGTFFNELAGREAEPFVTGAVFLAFLLAVAFGAMASGTNFCTMGGISDWVNMGDKSRLRAWFLAIGIAILGTQILAMTGKLNLAKSIYYTSDGGNLRLLGHIIGGFLFGIGMTMAGGCGQRILVRVGGGNLKSIVVVIVLGITAYATNRGLLSYANTKFFVPTAISVGPAEGAALKLGSFAMAARLFGLENIALMQKIFTGIFGFGFIAFALASKEYLKSAKNIISGLSIGFAVILGWYITGVIGQPEGGELAAELSIGTGMRVESFSFITPTANFVQYLMTYTGTNMQFGEAIVIGMIVGAFLFAVITRKFTIESFMTKSDMISHLVGAVLMGFGGVIALGCTIGQGVSGMSSLSFGAMFSLFFITLGSILTLKVQYYLLEEQGFAYAIKTALKDVCTAKIET